MDTLRELFETLSFINVATLIASGNVIFESAAGDTRLLQTRIEHRDTRSALTVLIGRTLDSAWLLEIEVVAARTD